MKKKLFPILTVFTAVVIAVGCGVKANREFMGLIDASVKNCDYGDEKHKSHYGWKIEKCDEIKKASEWVKKNSLTDILSTLAVALNDEDEKKASTAVYLLNKVRWERGSATTDGFDELADKPDLISDSVAKLYMDALKKHIEKDWLPYASNALTYIAVIKGLDRQIIAVANEVKPYSRLQRDIYVSLLRYGREKNFDVIKEMSKSDDTKKVGIAVSASGVFRDDRKIPDQQLEEYCAFAQQFLAHEYDLIASNAGATMARLCKGAYIDKALDAIEKRINESGGKKLEGQLRYTLTYIHCPSNRTTEEQCKRKEALLKRFDALK